MNKIIKKLYCYMFIKSCKVNKQKDNELYNKFCKQNIYDLLHGRVDIDKMIKLRDINFSFDFYIDEVIKDYKSYNKEDYNNE